jgi:transcriptional regulator with XRE-family HTH domain
MIFGYTDRVKIPRAILALRSKVRLTQPDLAKLLETSTETISRWENGHQAPTIEALQKLGAIAESNEQADLLFFFEKTWKARVAAAVKNLPSAGSPRRVPLRDLKYWSAYLYEEAKRLENLSPEIAREYLLDFLRLAASGMLHVRHEIETQIQEPYSLSRIEEDAELLRQPRSTSTAKPQPERKQK